VLVHVSLLVLALFYSHLMIESFTRCFFLLVGKLFDSTSGRVFTIFVVLELYGRTKAVQQYIDQWIAGTGGTTRVCL
jgi:uncharacterized membrane protein (DUF373 family)